MPSAEPGEIDGRPLARVETTDNADLLFTVLPERIRCAVAARPADDLLEIVLDLGRRPEARHAGETRELDDVAVTRADLDYAAARVGRFTSDNRAGIEGTLHRIAALRNRAGEIVGLTCRVGRAVTGTVEIVRDLFAAGPSVLLLGRPGVGKTTLLREAARVLADDHGKRVVVVDTSNEIAGDGDVPHPGIGRARRMQVVSPDLQHAVMIEAVENHMPEVVVVDEIGTHAEALAARTIAERGVQLIATAHGTTLENLVANPTLADLVGGIGTVTLGDEEARRRRTQKTILERKAPPTFQVLIEIQDRYRFAVHADVAAAVDELLAGRPPAPEIRERDDGGEIRIHRAAALPPRPPRAGRGGEDERRSSLPAGRPRQLYAHGVSLAKVERALEALGLAATVTPHLRSADLVLTIRGQENRRGSKLEEARRRGLPIRIVRANSQSQIERTLAQVFSVDAARDLATREAEEAVETVLAERRPVELPPRPKAVRRMQHQLAEERGLPSMSEGQEPFRRVTIFPPLAPPRPVPPAPELR